MPPVVTATILFMDLVDSTALAVRIGDRAMDRLRAAHFRGLRDAIQSAGGTEVKTIGDAVMVAFSSVNPARDCAADRFLRPRG
jgi:class 3 adenylate cyclase